MKTTDLTNNLEYTSIDDLKNNLLNRDDLVNIKWKTYINKSWYRKIALALNISVEVVAENRIEWENKFIYDFTVRATNSMWRYIEASGSCCSNEREFNNINHDVRATAQTRATNRAIADLIGLTNINTWTTNTTSNHNKLTPKQRLLLVKLVESKYPDEHSRNILYKKIDWLNKEEASKKIKQLKEEWVEILW